MAQKANIKNVELTNLTINFKDVWYLSSTNKLCTAHTAPTSNNKYPPKPINVKIKSAIDAPKGPPKFKKAAIMLEHGVPVEIELNY